jgi:hypothetical protein
MRGLIYRSFLFVGALILFGCASAPYKTSLQLNPEPGKLFLNQQDLDNTYDAAVSTGLDLGYRVSASSREQRIVTLNRLRSSDLVSETMVVGVESKGPSAEVSIVYESPKPLADTTVKEFTDRFLAKLKVRPVAVQPVAPAPASSRPGVVRVEPEPRPTSVEASGETHLILLKRSNIRTEPTTKSKVITTLRKGAIVVKIDESGDWFNVRLPSGETGWIFKTLVKETE